MRPVTAEGGIDAITARKASSPTAIENIGRRALRSTKASNSCSSAAPNATTISDVSAANASGPTTENIRMMPISRPTAAQRGAHFASSFSPSLMSCAVSALSPARREAPAIAAAACGWP